MLAEIDMKEYMAEVRARVCTHCIERPPGGPPCAPRGKQCGVELHLPAIVELCHRSPSGLLEPYRTRFHADVCSHCLNRDSEHCPCPLDYLLPLAIEAIEAVDERHALCA